MYKTKLFKNHLQNKRTFWKGVTFIFKFSASKKQTKMNTIIIDDEKPAINVLANFVEKVPFLKLKLATRDAFKGMEILNTQKVDLLLLDIEMPDITGIELLKSLEKKPLVIFTTAYDNYALQGYELDVLDYLVKPIRFDRFLKAVNKAHKLHLVNKGAIIQKEEGYLLIKVEYKNVKVHFSNILYVEGLKDYVKVYTKKEMYLTRLNLKNIHSKLPADQFLRVHRSYIVPVRVITSFQKGHIYINKIAIPVGITYQKEVIKKIE